MFMKVKRVAKITSENEVLKLVYVYTHARTYIHGFIYTQTSLNFSAKINDNLLFLCEVAVNYNITPLRRRHLVILLIKDSSDTSNWLLLNFQQYFLVSYIFQVWLFFCFFVFFFACACPSSTGKPMLICVEKYLSHCTLTGKTNKYVYMCRKIHFTLRALTRKPNKHVYMHR